MKKTAIAVTAALLCLTALPAAAQKNTTHAATSDTSPSSSGTQVRPFSFFITAGPMLLVNTASSTTSAPSPIMFSCGFGATLFEDKPVQFEPRLSFYTNYYLWSDDRALPAEVENRTATVLSFMFDLPAVYTWKFGTQTVKAGAGLGFLARIGILSNGVSGSDENRDDSSRTASEDVDDINSYLWSNGRFLYPELCGSWTYTTSGGWKAGFEGRLYIPLGSIASGYGLDATILSTSVRLVLPL